MFVYNYNPDENRLYVTLPLELNFDRDFLDDTTTLFDFVKNRNNCKEVLISCKDGKAPQYSKLMLAYLYCSLGHLAKKVQVLWHTKLANEVLSTVHTTHRKFVSTDNLKDIIQAKNLNIYWFDTDKDVNPVLRDISELMVKYNFSTEPDALKEFFTTIIGEIVSNSYNHSEQDRVFLMYDVLLEDESFALCVNIIDYGKTIIENVNEYLAKKDGIHNLKPEEALQWAIQSGNTTREGSGGYGFPTLISYLEKVSGELDIFSGNACYLLKSDGTQSLQRAQGHLDGTSVTFKIKLFNFKKIVVFDPVKEKINTISLDSL